jgi:NADPH:quinone reductase-like Zn-dependent oxidoreductase
LNNLTLNYITTYQLFNRVAGVTPEQRALIHAAAGGTGTAMLQVGKQIGLGMYGRCDRQRLHLAVRKILRGDLKISSGNVTLKEDSRYKTLLPNHLNRILLNLRVGRENGQLF